jgi:hypothetical protein
MRQTEEAGGSSFVLRTVLLCGAVLCTVSAANAYPLWRSYQPGIRVQAPTPLQQRYAVKPAATVKPESGHPRAVVTSAPLPPLEPDAATTQVAAAEPKSGVVPAAFAPAPVAALTAAVTPLATATVAAVDPATWGAATGRISKDAEQDTRIDKVAGDVRMMLTLLAGVAVLLAVLQLAFFLLTAGRRKPA